MSVTTTSAAAAATTAASTSITSTSDTSTSGTSTSGTTSNVLGSDFNTFLTLLTTQLQNQDPTSPMDTNQFTEQLVQFASVEQEINTNTNLSTLISLSKASSLYQASSMIGHTINAQSTQLALQNGSAALQFSLSAGQAVNVTVSNTSGGAVYSGTVQGVSGTNQWTWNGQTNSGGTAGDGIYNVSLTTASGNVAVPFTVQGVATSVDSSGATPTVTMGQLTVPMSSVQGVVN